MTAKQKNQAKKSFWAGIVSRLFSGFKRPWAAFLKALKDKARAHAAHRAKLIQNLRESRPSRSKPHDLLRPGIVRELRAWRYQYAQWLKACHPELNRKSRRDLCRQLKFS
jgi:hypothetical protein